MEQAAADTEGKKDRRSGDEHSRKQQKSVYHISSQSVSHAQRWRYIDSQPKRREEEFKMGGIEVPSHILAFMDEDL